MSTPIVLGWILGWLIMSVGLIVTNEDIKTDAVSFLVFTGVINAFLVIILIIVFGWHP